MIDITQETLIPLREAPRRLPRRPNGNRVHISACYRWISRGVRGFKLEAVRIGGTTYTSLEALQRFGQRIGGNSAPAQEDSPPQRARQREIFRASMAARAELWACPPRTGLPLRSEVRTPEREEPPPVASGSPATSPVSGAPPRGKW
jgi:hypothetical protein